MFPCPRSRLRIWSREKDSAVPSRVSLIILHTQADACYNKSKNQPGKVANPARGQLNREK